MKVKTRKLARGVIGAVLVSFIASVGSSYAYAQLTLDQQRDLYDQAQNWLDDKNSEQYQSIRSQLLTYPLTPYLDYRTFLLNLSDKSPQQVNEFIQQYQNLPFSGRIQRPYFRALAQDKQWQKLLAFSSHEPNSEVDRCYFYTAQWYQGDKKLAISGATKLWLQGRSVAAQCDDLFAQLEQQKSFNDSLILQRIKLAFQAGNPSLMSYLSKKLNAAKSQRQAKQLSKLYADPESVSFYLNKDKVKQADWPIVKLGLERLSKIAPKKAQALLVQIAPASIPTNEKVAVQRISERTAARFMDTQERDLAVWRDKVLRTSGSEYYLEQRIRAAIEQNDWQDIHRWISLLPPELQKQAEWQYWLGRAEMELGKTQYGGQRLFQLLGQRNFYSVSAANILNKPITYPIEQLTYEPALLDDFSVALVRIKELLARDKNVAARSEWYWLLRRASQQQKAMLAHYALQQDWPHFSVAAAIQAKLWGNLTLRFPIAHLASFKQFAADHQLDPVTLMSLARQESALDNMAQSHVGARGLMQLMPKTARYTAKKYQLSLRNDGDLYRAEKNIEIGSRYFAELMERYSNNRVLALAAYNAGPSRVDRWLEERGGRLDVFQFIESIPFKETRNYVQNILMFETYYREQLGLRSSFFKEIEINSKY